MAPDLLVKAEHMYWFQTDEVLENDSTLYVYGPPFVIDADGDFQTNGPRAHTEFQWEGVFPFTKDIQFYYVDSLPADWNNALPHDEGIYFYENRELGSRILFLYL